MSYLDEIASKRQAADANRNSQESHTQLLDANFGTKQAIEDSTKNLASKDDMQSIIKELQQMHVTTLLEANKPKEARQMNITDSAAYVGDSIEEMGAKILDKLGDSSNWDSLKGDFDELSKAIHAYNTSSQNSISTVGQLVANLKNIIEGLEMNPVINVPTPEVTVQAAKVDLKPLQKTLERYLDSPAVEEKLDLNCYRAQDIKTDGNIQYVGFVDPTGKWYIIENRMKDNSLRYVFGSGDYEKAFAAAATYQYSLLNEAINEVQA